MIKNNWIIVIAVSVLILASGLSASYADKKSYIQKQLETKDCALASDLAAVNTLFNSGPGVDKEIRGQHYICLVPKVSEIHNTQTPETPVVEIPEPEKVAGGTFTEADLKSFTYDKKVAKTYTNSKYGFSFDYPADWTLKAGAKDTGWSYDGVIYPITLINSQSFPTAGKQTIDVQMVTYEGWSTGGGMGIDDQFMEVKDNKGKPMYFNVYWSGFAGDGGDWHAHDPKDTTYEDRLNSEQGKASNAFEMISSSLKSL